MSLALLCHSSSGSTLPKFGVETRPQHETELAKVSKCCASGAGHSISTLISDFGEFREMGSGHVSHCGDIREENIDLHYLHNLPGRLKTKTVANLN